MSEPMSEEESKQVRKRVLRWVKDTAHQVDMTDSSDDTVATTNSNQHTVHPIPTSYYSRHIVYSSHEHAPPPQHQRHTEYPQDQLHSTLPSLTSIPSDSYQHSETSPTYSQLSARSRHTGQSRSRRYSSSKSASMVPGNLAELYVPTVSLSGSRSVLEAPANTPSTASYAETRAATCADSSEEGSLYSADTPQEQPLQQDYSRPPSPDSAANLALAINTRPRALASSSHHSSHRPHSSLSRRPLRSHGTSHSHSNSGQSMQLSSTPSHHVIFQSSVDQQVVIGPGMERFVVVQTQQRSFFRR